jgi:hypothetical protein
MDSEKFLECVENWKECDIASIVKHFHYLPQKTTNKQFARVEAYSLNLSNSDEIRDGFKKAVLHLGLTKSEPEPKELTFVPILEVFKEVGIASLFEFSAVERSLHSGIVPLPFKDALAQNWLTADQSIVDDLFVATQPTDQSKNGLGQLQRLHNYQITGQTNAVLFEILNSQEVRESIQEITFHLGADMNKLADKSSFTFSPIIEIRTSKKLSDKEFARLIRKGAGYNSIMNKNDFDGIFVEYMMPCPSTC